MRLIADFKFYGNWYDRVRKAAFAKYGSDTDIFMRVLAATSPRLHVTKNYRLTKRIMFDFLNERPITLSGLMPCHIPNVHRALSGKELSGQKVRAFYENLAGNSSVVTIDVWMLRFFRFTKVNPSTSDYTRLSDRIRRLAKRYNLTPAALQAIIWTAERAKNGKRPASFSAAMDAEKQTVFIWAEN